MFKNMLRCSLFVGCLMLTAGCGDGSLVSPGAAQQAEKGVQAQGLVELQLPTPTTAARDIVPQIPSDTVFYEIHFFTPGSNDDLISPIKVSSTQGAVVADAVPLGRVDIEVDGLDGKGDVTAQGSSIVDVQPGVNPAVSIILVPVGQTQP
jgi:hypothetical protein